MALQGEVGLSKQSSNSYKASLKTGTVEFPAVTTEEAAWDSRMALWLGWASPASESVLYIFFTQKFMFLWPLIYWF